MTPDEKWLPVVGYEGSYEVSDQGRVRSVDRWRTSGNGPYLRPGQMLKPNTTGPYPMVMLRRPEKSVKRRVHVIVAAAFIGPRPAGMDVCHNNGNPLDNRAANLRYDTHSNNARDMVKHGTNASRNKTHCPAGHLYDETNTLWTKRGRECRACKSEKSKAARAAQREREGKVARADRTECKYGHPLDGKNATQRFCKTCRKAASDRFVAKKKAAQAKE